MYFAASLRMCKPRTILKIGAILIAVFVAGWFVFPNVRASLIVIAPFALIAICPLAMLGGMYGMHRMGRGGTKHGSDCCAGHVEPAAGKEKDRAV